MSIAGDTPVDRWRFDELLRLWPDMPIEKVQELAWGEDRLLLEKARQLKNCPWRTAYEILR